MKTIPLILPLTILLIFQACARKKDNVLKKVNAQEISIKGNFSPQTIRKFDSTSVNAFLVSFPKFQNIKHDLLLFYRSRAFAYAWFDDIGLIEQAGNLFNSIKNIQDEGLDSRKQLYLSETGNLIESVSINNSDDSTDVITELMLTAQYLWYAKNVWTGLDNDAIISLEWLLPRKKIMYQTLLDSLLAGNDILISPPINRQYYLLKDYLRKYKMVASADTVQIKVNKNDIFKLHDTAAMVLAIRTKLFLLGDLRINTLTPIFDSSLHKAVQHFQERHGLKKTGIVKVAEVAELNVTIQKRIEQIMANMERSRWLLNELKENYILVNIPEFKLHVIEKNSLQWSMNVVVGKSQHKTAVFNGTINCVVFSPYWNIPSSIKKNEILPAIRRNKNYLRIHNMEWNGNNIRQKPGPNNALGLVKFLFPNTHSIYLHDSPAKSLFNESSRAFSHGCIRVAEAKKLAEYLLRYDSSWTEEKIVQAMNAGKEKYVNLQRVVPVYITYFTSWVNEEGILHFRKDIYNRDTRLIQMLLQ
jgi:murein L,D-transpeptidase YcbB/YkuD